MSERQPEAVAATARRDPLDEVYHRVVTGHHALAVDGRPNDAVHRWAFEQLADILRYIEQERDREHA